VGVVEGFLHLRNDEDGPGDNESLVEVGRRCGETEHDDGAVDELLLGEDETVPKIRDCSRSQLEEVACPIK